MSEILIIGGGIIGLSIARNLRKLGVKKITILERGKLGHEASFAAAGMLAVQAETNKCDAFFRFCDESRNLFPNFASELLDETGIDIELETSGTLYLSFSENDSSEINKRFELQKLAGLTVEKITATEIRKMEPFISPDVREGLFFEKDWQVENRKLLSALQLFAENNNIDVCENEEAVAILNEKNRVIGVETKNGKFLADKVILTTGAWTSFIKTTDFMLPEIKPIRGQMLSVKTAKRLFSKVIYSPRGYIVPRRDGRILAGATVEDVGFDANITREGMDNIFANTVELVPSLENLGIAEKWSGLRPFFADGLPILGRIPNFDNILIATAHFRNGILLAPKTAEIIAKQAINSIESEYSVEFGISRLSKSGSSTN
jgi:glycine oxidase